MSERAGETATRETRSPSAFDPYLDAWRERIAEERRQAAARRERALSDARRIARFLADEYDVRSAAVFGSIARGDFHSASDLDLAVEGLEDRRYFEALARASEMTELPLEIKIVGDCPPLLRRRIAEEGIPVLESEG